MMALSEYTLITSKKLVKDASTKANGKYLASLLKVCPIDGRAQL